MIIGWRGEVRSLYFETPVVGEGVPELLLHLTLDVDLREQQHHHKHCPT